MPQKTDIQWADYSSNPIKLRLDKSGKTVNACIKVSEGCRGCYAESITRHWWPKIEGKFPGYTPALMKLGDIVLNDEEVRKLLTFKPKGLFKNGDGPMVFIEDMSDIAAEFVSDEILDRLFAVFALRPDVVFHLLTKRPERMAAYLNASRCIMGFKTDERVGILANSYSADGGFNVHGRDVANENRFVHNWPLPNVWLGTSVENQQCADERIPHLLRCPAAIRFLSQEPQLEKIVHKNLEGIHWIIQGGESGAQARPFDVEWARTTRDQCRVAGTAYFLKQLGAEPGFKLEDEERVGNIMPSWHHVNNGLLIKKLKDSHGGDMAEWPADLRIRQFPTRAAL